MRVWQAVAAIDAIDWLLDCLYVPIRKAAWRDYLRHEAALADLFLDGWGRQVNKAIRQLSEFVASELRRKQATEEDVQRLMGLLRALLGDELAAKIGEQAGELVKTAYIIGKEGLELSEDYQAHWSVGLSLEDTEAIRILQQHTTYWIGQAHTKLLSDEIEEVVRRAAFDQGLGREQVGQALKEAFGSQFEKTDAYWRGLAAVVMNRSRNLGSVAGLVEARVKRYEIFNPLDERTSPICRFMAGKVFEVRDLVEHRNAILAAKTPEEVKQIAPWPRVKEDPRGGPGALLVQQGNAWRPMPEDAESLKRLGLLLPPFHFHCRSSVIATEYEELDPTQPLPVKFEQVPDPPPFARRPPDKPRPPQEPPARHPDTPEGWGQIPPAGMLRYLKDAAFLGGAGRKAIYVDPWGNQYLVKPALAKDGVTYEPFRAYIQEAVSKLAYKILGPDRAIEVVVRELPWPDGKTRVCSVQRLLSGVQGTLKGVPLQALSKEQIRQILREHTLDWLVGNFDAHPGQFIILQDGTILGADKEQAFRFWRDPKSHRMSRTYNPNPEAPIYNALFDAFAQGKVDLGLNDVLPAIQRVEAIPDGQYLALFEPYVSRLPLSDADKQKLREHILWRKRNLREEYRRFFSELLAERLGRKSYAFRFADELPAKDLASAPLAQRALSKATLQQMSWKQLFELAKAQKVKYAGLMTKEQLVEVLADPSAKAQIEAQAKAKLQAKALKEQQKYGPEDPEAAAHERRRRRQQVEPRPGAGAVMPREEAVWEDLSLVLPGPWGEAFHRDSLRLEDQIVTVRHARGAGVEGFLVDFKVTEGEIDKLVRRMKKAGAKRGKWTWYEGGALGDRPFFDVSRPVGWDADLRDPAWVYEADGVRIEVWDTPRPKDFRALEWSREQKKQRRAAMEGSVQILVHGDGPTAAARLKQALKLLGLDDIIAPPTEEDELRLKLWRMVWQHNPEWERNNRARFREVTVAELEEALREVGRKLNRPELGEELVRRARNLKRKDMGGGYFAWVDEEAVRQYTSDPIFGERGGVAFVWAGMGYGDAARVASVLQNGLLSSRERYRSGLMLDGQSTKQDFCSGGAEQVFCRVAVRGLRVPYSAHYGAGRYRVVLSPKVLERTDWYIYRHDMYGATWNSLWSQRQSGLETLQGLSRSYSAGNEIMFRRRVPPEYIMRVACETENDRQELLRELERRGVKEINGVPVDKFVVVEREIDT